MNGNVSDDDLRHLANLLAEALPLADSLLRDGASADRVRLRELIGGQEVYFKLTNVIAALNSERARATLLKIPYQSPDGSGRLQIQAE